MCWTFLFPFPSLCGANISLFRVEILGVFVLEEDGSRGISKSRFHVVNWKEFIHFGNACSKFSNFHVTVFPLVLSTRCLSNPATVHLGPRSVKASGVTLSRGVGRGVRRETARGIEWGALPSPCTTRTLQDVVPKLRDLSRFHFYLSLTRTDSIRMLYSIKSIPGDARLSFKLNARKKKKFSNEIIRGFVFQVL